ncbi:MAG: NADH-quinone oxidoreductase subunit NuoG [Ignavibacteriaceae bacterium]
MKTAKINIDGKTYEVDASKNLLEACLSLGLDLPYFCWHPAMGSVGACRQCAVKTFKDEKDQKGKLVMACLEQVKDGSRFSIVDDEAKEMRSNVIQWLMTNHPHDCPVCDEGGECHLQDMTVMTGHDYRKFRFNKRTYNNQYLGPFINHEMNRCIQCYRCVRFYRDYADGRDFDSFAAHNHVYFGRAKDGVLENEFSGNLIEVCPTGVFTDKTLKKHYTRKWDLTTAPSICSNCSLGCNIIAGERYGTLRRILSRYNHQVNGYFICDRGRFGYEYVNSTKRITKPLWKRKESTERLPASGSEVLNEAANIISNAKRITGIGSPRASVESNFLLKKLVGEGNFYNGIQSEESGLDSLIIDILKNGPAHSCSLNDIEKSDAVLILGEDLTNTAPMLALAVRQSVKQKRNKIAQNLNIPVWHDAAVREASQEERGPLFIAEYYSSKLDEIATGTYYAAPHDIAVFGFLIAGFIKQEAGTAETIPNEDMDSAKKISEYLLNADNPVIISGTSSKSKEVIQAAANIAWALCKAEKKAGLSFVLQESNSMGVSLLENKNLNDAINSAGSNQPDTLIILKNDLYSRENKKKIDDFLQNFKDIIVLDSYENQTTDKAGILLPAGTFAESDGTIVNNEGRAQRYYQVFVPKASDIKESWRWLNEIASISGKEDFKDLNSFYDFTKAAADAVPVFQGIDTITPPPGFRIAGQKIPREPHRFSGRTAMNADLNVSEPKPPEDPDSALTFTMEGYKGEPPSSIIPFFWSPGWNSVQSINKYQIEVGGSLHGGDPGRRLLEPSQNDISFFKPLQNSFKDKEDEFFFLPVYHIFGSDELSNMSPAIQERIPNPYILLNGEAMKERNIKEGDLLEAVIESERIKLPVKLSNKIPKRIAGLPKGLPGTSFISLPAWGKAGAAG